MRTKAPLVILAAGMAGCAVLLLVLSRHEGFFQDEYFWILHRRAWNASAFLDNHNGHFSLVPVTIYKLLFVTVGLGHTWPYRVVLVALHLLCAGLLFAIAAPRLGRWLALLPAALLLGLGAGAEDLLWAFQMGIVGALAAALGALLCLDRRDRRGDIAASVLLFVSLASDSVGVPFTIAVLIVLLVSADGRRRAWVAGVPLALYAIWYLGWGSSQIVASNIPKTPGFDEKLAAYGFAGLLGVRGYGQAAFGSQGLGQPLLLLAVAGLVLYTAKRRRLPERTLLAILAALGFWTLVALTRAQYNDPGAERYLYASGVLILLGAVTLLRWRPLGPVILAALVAIVAFAVYSNLTPLRQYAHERTATDASVRAELGAAEIAGQVATASFRPDPVRLPWLYEGTYLDATRELGSPALSPGAIATAPAANRAAADRVLIAGERIAARHARLAGGPPEIESSSSLTVGLGQAGRCSTLAPTGAPTASAVIRVSPGHSLTLSIVRGSKAAVSVRRFGNRNQRVASISRSSSPAELAFPADGSQVPWRVSLGLQGPATVCVG